MQLEPCPACQRHVRTDERSCPFCAADIADAMSRAPLRRRPAQRLGRAALMSFGLSAGAAALTGCDDDANEVAIYGAPVQPEDASVDARVQDAEVRDAAGASDAARPDAARPDASAADASTADAATVDASLRDAGDQIVPLYGGADVPIYGAPVQRPPKP